MKIDKEEQQLSTYEIQLSLNEKCYKGHFNSIKNLKRVLAEAQKLYDQNDDIRVKNKCIEIRKTAQKQLTELDKKTTKITRNYLIKKKELESLK
jgi:hypothetical protein